MTFKEAQAILRRRPGYVQEAGCDNVRHWIEQYLDPDGVAELLPGEDAYDVAGDTWDELNYNSDGENELPITVEELAAYFVVVTAEKTSNE